MSGSEWKTRPGPLSFLGYVVRHRTSGNPARSSPPTTFVPSLRPSLSLLLSPPLPSFLLLFSTLEHGFLATLNTTVAQLACLESQQRFPNLYFVQGASEPQRGGSGKSPGSSESELQRASCAAWISYSQDPICQLSSLFRILWTFAKVAFFFFLKRGLRLLPRNRDICICSHA